MESQAGPDIITILVDHNIEGQALMLWVSFVAEGWLALMPIVFARFCTGKPADQPLGCLATFITDISLLRVEGLHVLYSTREGEIPAVVSYDQKLWMKAKAAYPG